MNIRKNIWVLIAVMLQMTVVYGGGFIDTLGKSLGQSPEKQKIFFTALEEKREKLDELQKERDAWRAGKKAFQDAAIVRIQELKTLLEIIKRKLKDRPDEPFLMAQFSFMNEDYQIVTNIQQSREQIESLIEQLIALLEQYIKDPNHTDYKKRLNILPRDTYSFADLQRINQLMLEQKNNIEILREQEKNIETELKNRKHAASVTEQEYKQKKEAQAAASPGKKEFDTQQKRVLTALEDQLYSDKKERDQLRLKEIEYKKALIRNKIFIQELQLDVLRDIFTQVKPAIQVSEDDIAVAREEFVTSKRNSLIKKESYNKEIEALTVHKKEKDDLLQTVSTKDNISLGKELDEWSFKSLQTPEEYGTHAQVALLNEEVHLLQAKKDLLVAQGALEDEMMRYDAVYIDVMESVHKMTTDKFASEEETKKEIKKYGALNAEVQANISLFKERSADIQEQIKSKKSVLKNIDELLATLQKQEDTLFKDRGPEFEQLSDLLHNAQAIVKQEGDALAALSTVYTDIIASLEETNKQLIFIMSELSMTTIWQRPEYAITWEGVENIVPNMQAFGADLQTSIARFDTSTVMALIRGSLGTPAAFIWLVIYLCLFYLMIIAIRWGLSLLIRVLHHAGRTHHGLRLSSTFCVMILEFLRAYLVPIALWITCFLYIRFYMIFDPYVFIVFYLASIPYLLYIARGFITHVQQFNERHDYLFLAEDFQRRFIAVFATSIYATITILLFRKSYLMGAYFKSELPEILFLLWIIILQISMIFLLTKEQILGIIPSRGGFWQWIRAKVDQYYYLILLLFIAIIIMSNPFVGFGKLVIYVLVRLIKTIFVLAALRWLNAVLQRGFSHIFFTTEREIARERFYYGKSLYGFVVIAFFLSFIFLGAVLVAKIWGWPSELATIGQWADIMAWLKTPILLKETARISVFSVLQVLFFIVMGAIVALLLNRFVMEKIFDILLIEPGVQNTVSSLMRYIILILAVILGFQSIDLVAFVWGFIGALAIGIGWVIKDPMADVIAYFIILVQRPLKIGDFVKMDEEVLGVVRKITPRSVILRRKNSTTIVLPNSHVITKPVINWNYQRGFVAFNDIVVTVGYKEDPVLVQKLFLEVLAANQYILKSPQPIVRLENFSEYGFEFMVRGYISSNYTLDQWDIASDVRLAIAQRLRENNILIAVPTRILMQPQDKNTSRRNEDPALEAMPGDMKE